MTDSRTGSDASEKDQETGAERGLSASTICATESAPSAQEEPPKPLTTRQAVLPLLVMTLSGCLQGLAIGFSLTLNKHFQDTLHLSKTASTGLQIASSGAYLIGAPTYANYILRRWGYRWSMVVGLSLYSLGAILFWPSGLYSSFPSYCVAFFIMACGKASIEMVENPYIATCGPARYAEMRVNLIQALKAVCCVLSGVLASYVMFPNAGSNRNTTRALMYVYLADGVTCFVLALVFLMAGRFLPGGFPEQSDVDLAAQSAALYPEWKQLPLRKQTNLWLATASSFCYTGSIMALLAFFVNIAMEAEGASPRQAAQHLSIGVASFTAGRLAGAVLMGYVKPRHILCWFTLIATVLNVIAAVPAVGGATTWLLIVSSFFRACTHGTTVTFGIKGLGELTRLGAGILTAADCGGALFAPLTGVVIDRYGIRAGQSVPAAALCLAALYPVWVQLSKQGKMIDALSKDMPNNQDSEGGLAINSRQSENSSGVDRDSAEKETASATSTAVPAQGNKA